MKLSQNVQSFALFSLVLTVSFYLATYSDIQVTGQVASVQTPAPIVTPIYTEIFSNGWKNYENDKLGFSLNIPPDASIEKELVTENNRLVIYDNLTSKFEVRINENKDAQLSTYSYLDIKASGRATLAGQTASVFTAPKGYCDGPSCSEPFVTYATKNGDDFYNLVFYGDSKISEEEKEILASFKLQ